MTVYVYLISQRDVRHLQHLHLTFKKQSLIKYSTWTSICSPMPRYNLSITNVCKSKYLCIVVTLHLSVSFEFHCDQIWYKGYFTIYFIWYISPIFMEYKGNPYIIFEYHKNESTC